MIMYLVSILLLFIFFIPSFAGIEVKVNGEKVESINNTVFTSIDDVVHLEHSANQSIQWVRYKPVLESYDVSMSLRPAMVIYKKEKVKYAQSIQLNKLEPGTYWFGQDIKADSLISANPVHFIHKDIIQLVVREDDTYTGYLTELLNLPFILPPRSVSSYGHQTDLRIGTDCAELAIYGQRRMGKDIPYCGPRNIYNYLDRSDKIKAGAILHFGFQVSVVYQDLDHDGNMDPEDLLIQAYKNKVEIVSLANSGLKDYPYQVWYWKE